MEALTAILILLPFGTAVLCYLARIRVIRNIIILISGGLLIASAFLLIPYAPFSFSPKFLFGLDIHILLQVGDFLLPLLFLYFGFKHNSLLVKIFSILQLLFILFIDFFLLKGGSATPVFYCDNLSLLMVLIVSVVGSLIAFQAIPYMKNHEEHLQQSPSKQPGFFLVIFLFLGAMNGLVLANDLMFVYFFFEMTTLCSFLLIRHDQTERAIKNAVRALWMNSLGGIAFALALILILIQFQSTDMQRLVQLPPAVGFYLLALALICVAAFVKSAQFPFQSWLLGAMVAPTPVSALLHSSTMVKIGVYLVLRFSPALENTFLGLCVALIGSFSFLSAAALAVGQSNGKKVLAYSTISNLGLIFACAGINTPEAFTAGVFLILFHAPIKALLFLSVGTIEQHIASRDIEDMRGLYAKMPLTALITVFGVVMMLMPPFGLLFSKWMAIQAAAKNPLYIILLATGSALTVMYWARWAGTLMSDPFAGKFHPERQPLLTWLDLGSLALGAGGLSVAVPWVYQWLFRVDMIRGYTPPYQVANGILENGYGIFPVLPLSLIAFIGLIVSFGFLFRATKSRIAPSYLCGLETENPGVFRGPMNQPVAAEARNYYLGHIFGESKLTVWINLGAGVLLVLLLGGAL
jgi:ech hydrogenase subunit A